MDNIDFKSGEIIYNTFEIDFTKEYAEQEECLREDLVQVRYNQGYLLDLGWYPEYDSNGEFVVQIIKNENWSNPVYKKSSKQKKELIKNLNSAVEIIVGKYHRR